MAKVVGDDLRHWKGKIFGPVSNNDAQKANQKRKGIKTL